MENNLDYILKNIKDKNSFLNHILKGVILNTLTSFSLTYAVKKEVIDNVLTDVILTLLINDGFKIESAKRLTYMKTLCKYKTLDNVKVIIRNSNYFKIENADDFYIKEKTDKNFIDIIKTLDKKGQIIYNLIIKGCSKKEISERLNIPLSTLKRQILKYDEILKREVGAGNE